MNKIVRRCFLLLILFLPLGDLAAKVSFSGLDLYSDNRLLFRADSDNGGALRQGTLFLSRLADRSMTQITAFPEKMELLNNGQTLQIRNTFGVLWVPVAGGLPRNIPGFPAFSAGFPAMGGRVEEMVPSADGKWILYVEPVTAAYGNLVLIDTTSGIRTLVASNVERPDRLFPASWSSDSRVFVYNRGGKLYYNAVNSTTFAVDERYRLIGDGGINSIQWNRTGDFFYLRGSTVYRVQGVELFARSVYTDFLEIGKVVGNIPFEFDPSFDTFWVAPDARSILFAKGGQNIFYYPMAIDDYDSKLESPMPYVVLPRSSSNLTVLWSPQGTITVIGSTQQKTGAVAAYRLETNAAGGISAMGSALPRTAGESSTAFRPLTIPVGSNAILSPDGTKALFWGDGGVVVYDYVNWRELRTISREKTLSCIWLDNNEFVIGGSARIERADTTGRRTLICLSDAGEYGFEERGGRILARNGSLWFATDGDLPWIEVNNPAIRPVSVSSAQYRVYLEKQSSGPYENLPLVRQMTSVGTTSLLPGINYTAAPVIRESYGTAGAGLNDVFSNAQGAAAREVALVFDLYDDSTGLWEALDILERFGFKATFFLNGDFIRRHPSEAKELAESVHETASMFYTPIELFDSRYQVEQNFIARGLARNEDEFFRATGKDLGLLWHAPYYSASSEIAAAAAAVGYRTIGRDVDPMDWVSREEAKLIGVHQDSAADMVDRIIEQKRPGSIIPIRLGLLPGGRTDYLFNRLGVLLDALVRDGYSIVPVSTLIEHSR